jgi:hypothetical protein
MKGKPKEHWMELCEQAANEQDPDKLVTLVKEINDLLEAKETRLRDRSDRMANESRLPGLQ